MLSAKVNGSTITTNSSIVAVEQQFPKHNPKDENNEKWKTDLTGRMPHDDWKKLSQAEKRAEELKLSSPKSSQRDNYLETNQLIFLNTNGAFRAKNKQLN